MEKYLEIKMKNQTDRYHVNGISVDEFIDYMVKDKSGNVKDIIDLSEQEFEGHANRRFCFEFSVDDRFDVCHYIAKHESQFAEKEWNKTVENFNKSL